MLISLVNQCRNKELKSKISPTLTLFKTKCFRILSPDGVESAHIWSEESLKLSVSEPVINSEYDPDTRSYTHTFTCSFQSFQPHLLQWCKDFGKDSSQYCLSFNRGSQDWVIGLEGLSFSFTHDSDSISLTFKSVSSYDSLTFDVYEPVIPKTYLHITGHLNPSLVTNNGGITVNDTPYYYKDLELDGDNAFDIAIEEPVTMENFSAEWAYLADSPLINIDLSEFDGKESLTDLSYAFKGNANLQYVTLPSCGSVTSYEECFYGCSDLLSVDGVPSFNGVTTFKRCFQNCTSLQSFSFGSWNIQSDPDCSYMFTGCTSLTSVDVDKLATVSKIDFMFAACNHLTRMNLYSKVWYVTSAENTFAQCTGLESLSLWGMDPLRVSPGQFASNNFFPSGAVNLVVDFNPSHAHGYNVTMLNNGSLTSYLNVLAHIPASLAGSSNDLTITAAQGDYIDANYPSLLNDVRGQGWLVFYTN